MEHPQTYMKRCLQLARMGMGKVSPNPMVGALIIYKNKIIGQGYHKQYGGLHAEVEAIASVKNKSVLNEATLFVNLEPCNHFGKTPPCTDLILKHKIPDVFIGASDPNPLVAGSGIEKLRKNGVMVHTNVIEDQCLNLNKRFYHYHIKKQPYIILKWAQTIDGFIDIHRAKTDQIRPTWITHPYTRILVHKWRSEEPAIMVGANTIIKDNPKLNLRDWTGQNPLKIIIDKQNQLHDEFSVFTQKERVLYFNTRVSGRVNNIEHIRIPDEKTFIDEVMAFLYEEKILSVIVEGGAQLLQSLIEKNYWAEARIFFANKYFHKGIKAPAITGTLVEKTLIGEDFLHIIKNTSQQ